MLKNFLIFLEFKIIFDFCEKGMAASLPSLW